MASSCSVRASKSALDVSVQARVLSLLEDLQHQFSLTYLLITHDLSVVENISDRVVVMCLRTVAELAPADELYANLIHPYTETLLSAVSCSDPDQSSKGILQSGDIPGLANSPSGCKLHPAVAMRASDVLKRLRSGEPVAPITGWPAILPRSCVSAVSYHSEALRWVI